MRRLWIVGLAVGLWVAGCSSASKNGSSTSGTSGTTGTTEASSGSGSTGSSGGSTTGASTSGACSEAIPIALDQPLSGDTTHARDDHDFSSTACTGYADTGPDLAYAFTPAASGDYLIMVNPTGGRSSSFDPAVYVLDTCPATGTGLAGCFKGADQGDSGDPEYLVVSLTAGKTYEIVVDSFQSSNFGAFTIEVMNAPAPPGNDTCASPTALAGLRSPGDHQTVQGDTFAAKDDGQGSCGGQAPDVVYSVTPSQNASLTAALTQPDGGTLDAVLHVQTDCGNASSDLFCNEVGMGQPVSLYAPYLAAGSTYFLWVDGFFNSRGPFTLDVSLGAAIPPPPNDACSGAIALNLSGLPDGGQGASTAFDTTNANNNSISDPNGACGGFGTGADLVYRVALPAPVPSLTATVTTGADGGFAAPLVYVRGAPCFDAYPADGGAGPAPELACGDSTSTPNTARAQSGPLDGGDYFIWVDGFNGSKGPGTLQVTVP